MERGDPLPYTLPLAKRLEVGLERKTWTLDVVPDPNSNPEMEHPMSMEKGNPLTFDGLMKLAEKHAVRFLKIMTCNNIGALLGMGLWEGLPLRNVIWATRPKANIRRVSSRRVIPGRRTIPISPRHRGAMPPSCRHRRVGAVICPVAGYRRMSVFLIETVGPSIGPCDTR